MSTVALTEEITASSLNWMVLRTPAGSLSGISSADVEAFLNVFCAEGPLLWSASATAAWAFALPWPNHGLQDPSIAPVSTKFPRSKGAMGEMSHEVSGSKLAAGVRG